jgi:hypothetical protein
MLHTRDAAENYVGRTEDLRPPDRCKMPADYTAKGGDVNPMRASSSRAAELLRRAVRYLRVQTIASKMTAALAALPRNAFSTSRALRV